MARRKTLISAAFTVACGPSVAVHEGSTGSASGDGSGTTVGGKTGSLESSSGGPAPLDGPGCGPPVACDRGRFEGHARIESQADLAAFEGYTEISGMLEIMNSQDLVCLDELACLEVVGRDVCVQNNAALRSTEGLGALRVVGAAYEEASTVVATVFVSENARLETLGGFGLDALRGSLVLWRNPVLREVTGFADLGGSTQLVVLENPVLEALPSLHGVGSLLCSINHNPRLCSAELDAICIPNLESYNGEECPEGPAPRAEYEPGASIQWPRRTARRTRSACPSSSNPSS